MKKERLLVRNFDTGDHLESFLVAAVASILIIRLFLEVTGYPKVGGESLHIAHVLWGGLMMVVAILLLLFFLGKTRKRVAVMYVVFILIVISGRTIRVARYRSGLEYLMNAVRELEEVAWHK